MSARTPTPHLANCLPGVRSQAILAECLGSLRPQSLGDFKLVIRDNAAADGTTQTSQEYAEDPRMTYVPRSTSPEAALPNGQVDSNRIQHGTICGADASLPHEVLGQVLAPRQCQARELTPTADETGL